jgi:hypothetical protein
VQVNPDKVKEIMEPSVKRKKTNGESRTEKVPLAHRWTVESFPVPQLSSRVLSLLAQPTQFLMDLKKVFINEVGDHFINVVAKSHRNIYLIYVAALMKKYPQIGECARLASEGEKIVTTEEKAEESETESHNLSCIDEVGSTTQTKEEIEKVSKEFGVGYLKCN